MKFHALVFTALLSFQTAATQAAAADTNGADPNAESSVARLSVALVGGVDSAELRALIIEWLQPIGLEVQIVRRNSLAVDEVLATDDDRRRVRVWLGPVNARRVRLYFADPRAERFLVREVPLEHGLDEVGREQLVQVLLSAAQAFVERRESTSRAAVKQSLPPPSVSKPPAQVRTASARATVPSSRFYWSAGARYALTLRGAGVFAQGPGATFESALELPTTRIGALAMVRYELPHEAESTNLRVTVSALALRFRFLLAFVRAKEREFTLELGGGIDRVLVDPRERDGSVIHPRNSSTHFEPSIGGAVAHFWYLGGARLGAGIDADLSLYQTYYDVLLNDQRRREIRPWQLRPGAFVGVAWR